MLQPAVATRPATAAESAASAAAPPSTAPQSTSCTKAAADTEAAAVRSSATAAANSVAYCTRLRVHVPDVHREKVLHRRDGCMLLPKRTSFHALPPSEARWELR